MALFEARRAPSWISITPVSPRLPVRETLTCSPALTRISAPSPLTNSVSAEIPPSPSARTFTPRLRSIRSCAAIKISVPLKFRESESSLELVSSVNVCVTTFISVPLSVCLRTPPNSRLSISRLFNSSASSSTRSSFSPDTER